MTGVFNLARNGVLALALAAPVLAGCGQMPTPSAEAPPPSGPPPELAGAPASPPPAPPPAYQAAEPPVITMAPIPNPPESASPQRRAQARRPSPPAARVAPHLPAPQRRAEVARPAPKPVPARPQVAQAAPRAVAPAPVKPAAPRPVAQAPAPAKPAPAAPATPPAAAAVPAMSAPAKVPPAAAPAASRVLELQKAAARLIAQSAVLTPPAQLAANQASEATLTIPAGVAETLKAEAVKAGLGDAAASINLTARLTGEGYVISPDETQSAPLIAGAPTVFHWSVIPRSASPGPLEARLGADLLGGGGATLDLGDIRPPGSGGFSFTPRLIGLALLVLIAAIVAIWAARRRDPVMGAPSSAERRAMRRNVRNGKPLDLYPKDI